MFSTFLETEVGGKSTTELLAELNTTGCLVTGWARHIFEDAKWEVGERTTVKFAQEKLSALGFTKAPLEFQNVRDRILELGHQLCEWTDCPSVAIAYKNISKETNFWFASKSLFEGEEEVFWFENFKGMKRTIGADHQYGNFLQPNYRIVFRL